MNNVCSLVEQVKKKLDNIRTQYSCEKAKRQGKSGCGTDKIVSKQRLFQKLSFLDQFRRPRKSTSNFSKVGIIFQFAQQF